MLERHTTRDGQTMLIAQMENSHLMNYINMRLRKMLEVKESARIIPTDNYTRRLYGLRAVTEEEAADVNRMALMALYPYLAEAYLRGLDEPRQLLIEVLGRDSFVGDKMMLPASIDDDNPF